MPRRTLGGGRVLGPANARSPSALIPSPQPSNPRHLTLSPSASSVSLNSQASASQVSSEAQDLTSRISLENGSASIPAAPAAAGAQLACPICSEEMVTLLQLNRHLDDVHQNLEDDRQDEVKDWFKTQMDKAKRFQPLAVLNQKLKGLDVFESNENIHPFAGPSRPPGPLPAHPPEPPRALDPDDVITRDHWQGRTLYDVCLEPSCGKRLNATNGCVNCRKCGKLFCEDHTMYQMKLSRSAQHEPVRGLWCRVCETCYKSREGYNDHSGLVRDRMSEFKAMRKQTVDKDLLEVSRLEKRLTRLTQLLASLPAEQIQSSTNKLWSISWQGDQRKALEQTILHLPKTPLQDLRASLAKTPAEKSPRTGVINVDIRLCKECRSTLFDRRDFEADIMRRPPAVRAYENLTQFERGIRILLPKFQKILGALQDPRRPPSSAQIAEASKVRKRLTDSFAQYDVAARRVRDMQTDSPTQQRLQKAIYQQASNFLHLHMLPLKSLPRVLKHASPNGGLSNSTSSPASPSPSNGSLGGPRRQGSALASIKYGNLAASGSNASLASDTSSAVSALEAEEKSLRERLIVLEEQKFFVSEMIADANRRRKFDEVSSLAMNIEDLTREIDRVNGMLDGLDFEGVYTGAHQQA
ncbi:vacuolar segregation protein [Aspergillus niger]|uniref:Vacuolar segregation protein n=1 Tax=Aspergillus niger TaxID=5061 RepID=A0A100I8S8_ASPNG|nr:vacuolar segregation protein [Aspergillus niger]